MSSATIRGMTCGYSPAVKKRKPITFFQAFADDSHAQSGRRRLVIAAYLDTAPNWEAFSSDWAAVRDAHPKVPYFKMVHAMGRQAGWRGLSEKAALAKIFSFGEVIRNHRPTPFFATCDLEDIKEFGRDLPHGLRTPYFMSIQAVCLTIAKTMRMFDVQAKCDFVFDEQDGVSRVVIGLWEQIIFSWPDSLKNKFNSSPIFRNDLDMLPLQAADMLAWCVRRGTEAGIPQSLAGLREMILPPQVIGTHVPADMIQAVNQEFAKIPGGQRATSKAGWREAFSLMLERQAQESL